MYKVQTKESAPHDCEVAFCRRSALVSPGVHTVFQSTSRLAWSKAPTYDTNPLASMQSPTRVSALFLSFSISLPHRSFSLERPPTNRSASDRRVRHAAASASTLAFSSVACSQRTAGIHTARELYDGRIIHQHKNVFSRHEISRIVANRGGGVLKIMHVISLAIDLASQRRWD